LLCCNNLFAFFLLIEFVVLLFAILLAVYALHTEVRILSFVALFFYIFSVLSAGFFLFGLAFVLFIGTNTNKTALNFSTVAFFIDFFSSNFIVINKFDKIFYLYIYIKISLCFLLIPFLVKFAVMPFASWVFNVYAYLPLGYMAF
jgi:NADH:ubiquinone oxidoreductase subunit 2 (subunit N)